MTGDRTCLAIVLAAGEGTRMRSARPKVLHGLAGQSLLAHTLCAVRLAGGDAIALVIGPAADDVALEARRVASDVEVFVQHERRGTAHAVLAARNALARSPDDILVVFADTPLLRPGTLREMRKALAHGASLAVLGFRAKDPNGYGRLLLQDGELVAIREELDATPAEREIDLCNAGIMAFAGTVALSALEAIGCGNRKSEFYLTDAVAIVRAMGGKVVVVNAEENEVRGVNTKIQLAETEAALQQQ